MTTGRADPNNFPEIQTGGSLLIAWQIKGKRVLLVGGGEVAATRLVHLLSADALVTLIAPAPLHPEVSFRLTQFPNSLTWIPRAFEPADLTDHPNDYSLILTAIDDPVASSQIYKLAHQLKIPANIADVPPECDFYFGSVHRDGPLQIMVSTNGKGPRLASTIRKLIAKALPKNAGRAIEQMGELRKKLREVAPAQEEGKRRMDWIKKVSDAYGWEEMGTMTGEDMANLLAWYRKEGGEDGLEVPTLDELRALRKEKKQDGAVEEVQKKVEELTVEDKA
ncbi:siroheme synthase [Neurospora crassa OR74A]|uniref:precorrin-2 dehydrogenase n=1 Tax=Neurospora crassa (strain ATCC 24698 / 74-OR23-1A / CBS 708.71 / DSM 1257 / FGSC 987) TaxID=367110 RepID=Q7SBH1_NEUCR|nr:siroheme synthase [Neurospora crassa OR74A]EAA33729.1 siroheme synthase [Neurospora crassa OR74A]|eukprot:XP_962965.1 siroheme synthase [Neurospora crassa OR74A]